MGPPSHSPTRTIETTVRATPGERWTEGLAAPEPRLHVGLPAGWTLVFSPCCLGRGTLGLALLAAQHPGGSGPPALLRGLRRPALAVLRAQDWTPQAEPLSPHLTAIVLTAGATLATAWALQQWTHSTYWRMPSPPFPACGPPGSWSRTTANWAYWIAIDAVVVLYAFLSGPRSTPSIS